jgi:hypothetical protein
MHGPEGVRFCTKQKAVTSRWPTGIRAGAEFKMPDHGLKLTRGGQCGPSDALVAVLRRAGHFGAGRAPARRPSAKAKAALLT